MAFRMVDVGSKTPSRRVAVASGTLAMGPKAFGLLKAGRLPKGDALLLGEVAGVVAAKNASATIPLCHPLSLDHVSVAFELDASLPGVRASCTAATTAKTGVEMEALAGVTGALLAVYDLVKQVDPALTISDVRLESKQGGKSGFWVHPSSRKKTVKKTPSSGRLGNAVVITVSDRASKGVYQDRSGPALVDGLRRLGFKSKPATLVPDEQAAIERAIVKAAASADVVALTGGTGLSARDVTPEAVAAVCDRLIPGFGEALRERGAAGFPLARLSRSLAGQRGSCVVVCLPGSAGGVRDGLEVLAELLPHAVHVARGGDHR